MEKTVLVVEDEEAIRKGICIHLKYYGFQCREAGDRPQALELLANPPFPHVILTDIMMPSGKQAGLDLLLDLKENENWQWIPTLVLSAKSAAKEILVALERGAIDYLIKPYEPENLYSRVQRAFEIARSLMYTMEEDSLKSPNEYHTLLRKALVDTLRYSLLYWELTTQQSKFELADKSGLWNSYVDKKGTYSTKTLDKYLHLSTLPQHPRTENILQTAYFVLQKTPAEPVLKKKLEACLSEAEILLTRI